MTPDLPRMLTFQRDWPAASAAELRLAWKAAQIVVASVHTLSLQGLQIVQSVLADAEFLEWQHYPAEDVRDNRRASQYFYHAHPGLQRPFVEHGHFHLFVHAQSLGLRRAGRAPSPAHLLAVSMDARGMPTGLFTVNRWVTKGAWLSRQECALGLQHFQIGARHGQRPVNQFLTALLRLYAPQIEHLLIARDEVLAELAHGRSNRQVFADSRYEVLSYLPIDLSTDIEQLERAAGNIL
ncbi:MULTISPECIES: DUF6969 family protein [unclassified Undibacterium]|uniref:DUF6969 family protein n=1 Tax=unclassified Undibacterium TaxID=2630295 RepID=UPI002AC8AA18|nr:MULTISPECIES: hypothetical protein [unclassified Undibacterium]MEB0137570.1 hypothetical protein [Undibacterium sp. CCC2.1]MEB0170571.1 hypothetical protein [Undibacterium sp. CCC1.1]MEB0174512.1 hypothetical protein [Undibacterium sp. CCC3.4]MEB0213691.1 hypothetical protein [Undibacterium sp. 5I2]WPX43856.1 hypothetical protein RHM61_01075 [Undibacterium sp. CCC3.4]